MQAQVAGFDHLLPAAQQGLLLQQGVHHRQQHRGVEGLAAYPVEEGHVQGSIMEHQYPTGGGLEKILQYLFAGLGIGQLAVAQAVYGSALAHRVLGPDQVMPGGLQDDGAALHHHPADTQ